MTTHISQLSMNDETISLCMFDVESTWYCGQLLGQFILSHQPIFPNIIAAYGDLGSGKTSLAQGIARGLGISQHHYVNSPTFSILQTHQGELPFHHIDLYRLYDEEELTFLGLDEIIRDGIAYIEWPQRAPEFFQQAHLKVQLSYQIDQLDRRELSLSFQHFSEPTLAIRDLYSHLKTHSKTSSQ